MSENSLHIHHIIWQPTFECSSNCSGCYIKGSKVQERVQANCNSFEILKLIFEQRKVTCDQFTISLDNAWSSNPQTINLLNQLMEQYEKEGEHLPSLCVTIQSYTSLLRYLRDMQCSLTRFLKVLYMLSLSTFPIGGSNGDKLRTDCQQATCILNYNKCADRDLTGDKGFEAGCRYADQTYLVLYKNPLGEKPHPEAFNWLMIAEKLAKKECDNVIIDSCFTDAIQVQTLGNTCGAGIHKVAVWPDGSVTACPYDTNYIAYASSTFQSLDVWTELQTVVMNAEHPMKNCDITKVIPVYKLPKNRVDNLEAKS